MISRTTPPRYVQIIWFDGVPVAVVDGQTDEIFLIRTDHIGRPVFATDANGLKVWEASYLPFGGVHVASTDAINLRFPGQWFHAESGLHQNWMRDYDPTTGRYLQADPLGLVPGPSLYGYAMQSPMMYADPDGEHPVLIAAIAGAALGALSDLGLQLLFNGGRFECLNWSQAGISAGIGAVSGGAGVAGKSAFSGWHSSHFIPDRLKSVKDFTKRFPRIEEALNRTHLTRNGHARVDPLSHQFLTRTAKEYVGNYGNPLGKRHNRRGRPQMDFGYLLRVPPWILGGLGAGIVQNYDNNGCSCSEF